MREIKFRRPFYNDKTGIFEGFSYWGVNVDEAQFVSPGSVCGCSKKPDEQFTGLKDKNGKECYEGDVYKNNEHGTIGIMSYEPSLGGYILWADEIKDGEQFNYLPFYELNNTNFEIIGNIHENTELLDS